MCARNTQFAKAMAGEKPTSQATVRQGGSPGTPAVDWEAEGKKSGALGSDFTDEALQRARKAQALMLSSASGRRKTFLSEAGQAPTTAKTLLGGY